MNSKDLFIFTHIPKTAGTSIRKHFQLYLEDQIEFIHLTNKGNKQARNQHLKPFLTRTLEQRNKAKVILGHQVNQQTKTLFTNKNIFECVFFREPVAWEISRYNQYANRLKKSDNFDLDFEYWMNQSGKLHSQFDWFLANYLQLNKQVEQLNVEQKMQLLSQTLEPFEHVLFIEDLPDCIQVIFDQINIPLQMQKPHNVAGIDKPKSFNNSFSNHQKLNKICAEDVEIYINLYKKYGLNDC